MSGASQQPDEPKVVNVEGPVLFANVLDLSQGSDGAWIFQYGFKANDASERAHVATLMVPDELFRRLGQHAALVEVRRQAGANGMGI